MSIADFIAALCGYGFVGFFLAIAVDQHFVWRKKTIAETRMYDSVTESLQKVEG